MVKGIVYLISLSEISLLACKNARDFYAFILYPAVLLNSSMSSNSFLAASLGCSMHSIMQTASSDSFISFPTWILLFLFLWLLWLELP